MIRASVDIAYMRDYVTVNFKVNAKLKETKYEPAENTIEITSVRYEGIDVQYIVDMDIIKERVLNEFFYE